MEWLWDLAIMVTIAIMEIVDIMASSECPGESQKEKGKAKALNSHLKV